jgi:IS30 family transposase
MAHTELDLRERRAIEDLLHAQLPVSKSAAEPLTEQHGFTVSRETLRKSFFIF